jgi:hypothetical protein
MNTTSVDVVCDERAGARGVDDPVEDPRTLADERAQVRLDVDHDEALELVGDHLMPTAFRTRLPAPSAASTQRLRTS